jgi:AP2 domain
MPSPRAIRTVLLWVMKTIQIKSRGSEYTVYVDDDSFALVEPYKWHLDAYGYAFTNSDSRSHPLREWGTGAKMHRVILGVTDPRIIIDHIDRSRLNNLKLNLRATNKMVNSLNRGLQSNNTSGYRGVSQTKSGSWHAYIKKDGKRISLGCFPTKQDAALAYNAASIALFGGDAPINTILYGR